MQRRIKVVLMVDSLKAIGGLERVTAEMATHLNPQDFDVEIWCISTGGWLAEQFKSQGLAVRIFNISNYYNPLNVLNLAWQLRRSRVDIVHTHIYFAATIGRVAAWLAGVKVIINHVHSMYAHYKPRHFFIERLLSRISQAIICVSQKVADFVVVKEGIDSSKVRVIFNGISLKEHHSRKKTRKDFKVADEDIIVVTVASLNENKGHCHVLEVMRMLSDKHDTLKYWIVGSGSLEAKLRAHAQALGIESRVVFWGALNNVSEVLSAADIFVLASQEREGLSLAVIEAMAYGVTPIVSDVGGLPELITHQENGLVVPPADAQALANALNDLIQHPQQREVYVARGLEKYKAKFDARIMAQQIEALYREFL